MKTIFAAGPLAIVLGCGVAFAAEPEAGINSQTHPELAAAQQLIGQARDKINEAQHKPGHNPMEGHAGKAKEYLHQANAELKLAAEAEEHPEAKPEKKAKDEKKDNK
jgi:hypothetical protein